MKRWNPEWIDARTAEIEHLDPLKRDSDEVRKEIDLTLSDNLAVQWMICRLAEKGIPFRLIQLGAGVRRITTKTDICPKCNGTGRC